MVGCALGQDAVGDRVLHAARERGQSGVSLLPNHIPKVKKEKKSSGEAKAVRGSAFDRVKVVEKPAEESSFAEGENPYELVLKFYI